MLVLLVLSVTIGALHNRVFMIQKRWSGLTAALMVSTLSLVPVSGAEQGKVRYSSLGSDIAVEDDATLQESSRALNPSPTLEAVKVGTLQSLDSEQPNLVAQVLPHHTGQYQAATLYVRDIPVLTFMAPGPSPSADFVSFETAFLAEQTLLAVNGQDITPETVVTNLERKTVRSGEEASSGLDPVWRATNVAAFLNYLHGNGLQAESINVYWDAPQGVYLVRLDQEELARIDDFTYLADTTGNPEQDALQAANRLRRLLGNAAPLTPVDILPKVETVTPVLADEVLAGGELAYGGLDNGGEVGGAVRQVISGIASWYGPGFHGALSASGEIFDQNQLTAAHPWLPFGTQVRVTNLDNGLSVILRINDRGPYVGDRILDVSAAAAQYLGMMHTGIAPVQVDVLD